MAKKRVKKRTHVIAGSQPGERPAKPGERSPKSLVIRIGAAEVGASVSQLVQDVRTMMEPATASRLKERRNNRLRDYTSMAGPLGITHLLLFSRSDAGNVQFRLAISPRGPTFCFRVEKYSLSKDVFKEMKRPKTGGTEYLSSPLLVMNNFSSTAQQDGDSKESKQIPKHLENLATTVFQSLFPPINPTATPLKSIRRVLLLDRLPQVPDAERASYVLNLRHYAIEARTAKSLPKALRRLDAAQSSISDKRKRAQVPNLGRFDDVSDYLLDPHAADGFTSGSESEPETDAEVEVVVSDARKVRNRVDLEKQKSKDRVRREEGVQNVLRKGIKLHELGPRMRLRLTKVEEGVCGGKVMWHEWIHKTKQEQEAMEKVHEARRQEKERRKAEQKANVARKKAERKANSKKDDEGDDEEPEEDWEDDEFDDEDVDMADEG